MYHQKLTNKQKEDLILKLTRKKYDIEFDKTNSHPESKKQMDAYKIFMSLTLDQKVSIRQAWSKYYEDVIQSPIYQLFKEQQEASKKGNWVRVRELAQDARSMRENNDLITLKKPTSIDPWEFDYGWVKDYMNLTKEIQELREEINAPDSEEQKAVWE